MLPSGSPFASLKLRGKVAQGTSDANTPAIHGIVRRIDRYSATRLKSPSNDAT
jgi:hypothetical protein